MTKKEYLQQAFNLHVKLEKAKRRLEVLNAHARSAGIKITDCSRTMRTSGSALEDIVLEILELEDKVNELSVQFYSARNTVSEAIKSVGDQNCENLLRDRYLLFLPWKEIAVGIGYSLDYTYELHGRALKLVKIPENQVNPSSTHLSPLENSSV